MRIYGYYPIIGVDNTQYYRHPIHTFDFTALDGKEKWTAYRFTRNIYDTWMPDHLRRICSVIDQIPILDPVVFTPSSRGLRKGGRVQSSSPDPISDSSHHHWHKRLAARRTPSYISIGSVLSYPISASPLWQLGWSNMEITGVVPIWRSHIKPGIGVCCTIASVGFIWVLNSDIIVYDNLQKTNPGASAVGYLYCPVQLPSTRILLAKL